MATRLESLMQQWAEATVDISEHRRATRAAKKKSARGARAQAAHWVLTVRERRVVLIAYALAGYDAEAAATFLASLGRQRCWPQKREEELSRMVEDVFLSVDVGEFAALSDVDAPSDCVSMRLAIEYVEQWRVVAWARRLLVTAGLAPSTAAVLERFEEDRGRWPEELRPPWRGTAAEPRARAWVRRWRARWGGHFGKVRVREPVTVEAAHAKAAAVASLLAGVGAPGEHQVASRPQAVCRHGTAVCAVLPQHAFDFPVPEQGSHLRSQIAGRFRDSRLGAAFAALGRGSLA